MAVVPAALPPLLAGPVLRRVESDLVSVWIATSRACNVSLLLFDGGDIVASRNQQDDLRAKWVSEPQPTVQVGAHLHVLTVVLDLRNPGGNASRSNGATLQANHTFSYDLRLIERADPTRIHNLRSLGLVADPTPIGYDPGPVLRSSIVWSSSTAHAVSSSRRRHWPMRPRTMTTRSCLP